MIRNIKHTCKISIYVLSLRDNEDVIYYINFESEKGYYIENKYLLLSLFEYNISSKGIFVAVEFLQREMIS